MASCPSSIWPLCYQRFVFSPHIDKDYIKPKNSFLAHRWIPNIPSMYAQPKLPCDFFCFRYTPPLFYIFFPFFFPSLNPSSTFIPQSYLIHVHQLICPHRYPSTYVFRWYPLLCRPHVHVLAQPFSPLHSVFLRSTSFFLLFLWWTVTLTGRDSKSFLISSFFQRQNPKGCVFRLFLHHVRFFPRFMRICVIEKARFVYYLLKDTQQLEMLSWTVEIVVFKVYCIQATK